MKFRVSANITYQALLPSTLILDIQPFKSLGQIITEERFNSSPDLLRKEWYATSGEKRFQIIEIPEPGIVSFDYECTVDSNINTINTDQLYDVPISKMPVSVLPYLNPSRYCQSDKLYKFSFNKFGKFNTVMEKVIAIRDWIFSNVEYVGGYSTPQTSAYDTITEQTGVCRDFAHLGIALCRALTIPARYFTGYAYQLQPPDFHACFEVFIGGYWIIVDATKLVPINGLVKIATGIDATDTALASIFGNLRFLSMEVDTNLLSDDFQPLENENSLQGYNYY
jgi:transglutaminase-like putative cysteine protease